jgi:hypothetical protein
VSYRQKSEKLLTSIRQFNRSSSENSYFVPFLFLMGLFLALLRVSFSQAEDMGLFMTVSGLLSKGYTLYEDIFDIKDPLFFYSNAVAINLFGLRGPFVFDAVLVALSTPLAYLLCRRLNYSKIVSISASLIFTLTLTGSFYQSFRTQIAAIDLILIMYILILTNKSFYSGLVFILIIGFKFPFAVFVIPAIALLGTSGRAFPKIKQFLWGSLVGGIIFIFLLISRGELIGYLLMNRDNFFYQQNYQEIVGQRMGLLGHFDVWRNSSGSHYFFLIYVFLLLFLAIRNKIDLQKLYFFLFLTISISVFLLFTAMWPHHLQVLSLFNLIFVLTMLDLFKQFFLIQKMKFVLITLLIGCNVFALIGVFSTTGTDLSFKPRMSLIKWIEPRWNVPVEIQMLSSVSLPISARPTFARLGSLDDGGFGGFLPSEWNFRCQRTAFGGLESLSIINEFNSCLRSEINVVLASPQFLGLNGRGGTYNEFYSKTSNTLKLYFTCSQFENSNYSYCFRKSLITY